MCRRNSKKCNLICLINCLLLNQVINYYFNNYKHQLRGLSFINAKTQVISSINKYFLTKDTHSVHKTEIEQRVFAHGSIQDAKISGPLYISKPDH